MKRKAVALRGIRRKAAAGFGVGLIAPAVLVPVLVMNSGAASAEPSSNINDYALFAVSTITLKGAGTNVAGNIGAGTRHYMPGNVDEWAWDETRLQTGVPAFNGDSHVTLCQGANPATKISGYVAAPAIRIQYMQPLASDPDNLNPKDPCRVKKLYAQSAGSAAVIPPGNVWPWWLHMPTDPSAFPDVAMPTLSQFEGAIPTACNRTASFAAGKTLAPGVYGDVNISHTTTLSAGNYTFCSLSVQQSADLFADPGTKIYVAGNVNWKGGAGGFVGNVGAKFWVNGTVAFGRNGRIAGTIVVPNDDVSLGNSTQITGHVWALAMHSDWSISVTQGPPSTTTTTGPSNTTAPTTTPPTTTTLPET